MSLLSYVLTKIVFNFLISSIRGGYQISAVNSCLQYRDTSLPNCTALPLKDLHFNIRFLMGEEVKIAVPYSVQFYPCLFLIPWIRSKYCPLQTEVTLYNPSYGWRR
jgi:hypothetical protein